MIKVLIGIIGSGKSTYCKEKAKEGFIIVNDDAIVNMLHADQYQLYSEHLKPLYKGLENAVISLVVALKKDVIVDRGVNISLPSRKRWIGLAHSLDTWCEAVVFKKEIPAIHAARRFEHDNRGASYEKWLAVAKRQDSEWEYPTLSEGFDQITYL